MSLYVASRRRPKTRRKLVSEVLRGPAKYRFERPDLPVHPRQGFDDPAVGDNQRPLTVVQSLLQGLEGHRKALTHLQHRFPGPAHPNFLTGEHVHEFVPVDLYDLRIRHAVPIPKIHLFPRRIDLHRQAQRSSGLVGPVQPAGDDEVWRITGKPLRHRRSLLLPVATQAAAAATSLPDAGFIGL